MAEKPLRRISPRRWQGLALAGAAVGLGIAAPTYAESTKSPLIVAQEMGATLWLTGSEGGEGGEGGTATAALSEDPTVSFLADLIQIEGHLASGMALLAAGSTDHSHMEHPYEEVYHGIEAKLDELGIPQFEDDLEAISEAVMGGKTAEEIDAIRAKILTRISDARKAAAADEPKDQFAALAAVVRKAGDEYGVGVKGGAVVELGEYQDSWGFIQAAKSWADALGKSDDEAVRAAAAATSQALGELDPALPSVTPQGSLTGDSTWFAGAAARIELAASKVK